MNEDSIFFQKAAEAIMVTSLNSEKVDPTIRELLNRVKYVSTPAPPSQHQTNNLPFSALGSASSQYASLNKNQRNDIPYNNHPQGHNNIDGVGPAGVIAPENKTILNYFDKLLSNPVNFVNQNNDGTSHSTGHTPVNHSGMTPTLSHSNDTYHQRRASTELENRSKKRKLPSKKISSGSSDTAIVPYDRDSTDGSNNADLDDKRFPCEKCHMVFRRSSDLRRHERQHLPILPNICTLCGKGFARKDALKRHFDTQTCKRNRQKLLSIGGDINEILERARQSGATIYSGSK
ncbi:Met32/Met31 [Kluyveromyces lactis]|nr:Met32/Met31 [Kluyveromyces lactis]